MAFDPYIGIPWVDMACGHDACDCWGLVRLIYREVLGLELPSFSGRLVTGEDSAAVANLINGERGAWDELPAGREACFDVITMWDGPHVSHVGMVVQPGLMIHVARGSTSAIERYRQGLRRPRIDGFFRYRG